MGMDGDGQIGGLDGEVWGRVDIWGEEWGWVNTGGYESEHGWK
jgi:hypothetical protein